MKNASPSNYAAARDEARGSAEILVLPDGRVLVHNLTPAVAALLSELAPHDPDMRRRAASAAPSAPSAAPASISPLHAPASPILPSP